MLLRVLTSGKKAMNLFGRSRNVLGCGRLCEERFAGSLAGLKGYDDKENAEEAIFFRKEDEKLLKELLTKVRAQAEKHDVHSAKGVLAAEKSALDEIVGTKLSDAEKEALMQWKHTHF
ncbi:hypothetical protein M9434_002973 [Picochlorum sp. BPE23]|nr:hypothetical protein M9434_002973 [Picochlorum sp. BPE23]KAI8105017.1 hypothetical protein M9435_000190 [Picochlorum sp. BPE23]WPT15368.1 hypothetical protein PSENEW3_00003309 [Picochlorum sp. SENEW3]